VVLAVDFGRGVEDAWSVYDAASPNAGPQSGYGTRGATVAQD
jgi:hypothetical protein